MVHPFTRFQTLPDRFDLWRQFHWNRRRASLSHDLGFEGLWGLDRTEAQREERRDGLIVLQRSMTGAAAGE
jgi:hypothetical protein